MSQPRGTPLSGLLCGAIAMLALAGCGKQAVPAAQAVTGDAATTAPAPTAATTAATPAPGAADFKGIAEEGFVYGLPVAMIYNIMYDYAVDKDSGQFKAPFNEIKHETQVYTYKDIAIVTPNSDTPYSWLWMDLRTEPMVLSVPAVPRDRYYSVQLTDLNSFNFGYIGSRATGSDAGDYMVVGPDWKGEKPAGIKQVFRSSSQFALGVYRTQLFNPDDMPNVEKVQADYKVQPLSAHLKQPTPPAAPAIDFPKIDKASMQSDFFDYLGFALQFAPPGPEEEAIRARLAGIGIGPGKKFDLGSLTATQQAAVVAGMKEGDAKIKQYLESGVKRVNGWGVFSPFGDRAFYNGDWLKRAAGAAAGVLGNDGVEAMYPFTRNLANGDVLDGSQHRYTLTFAKGQLPPVNAFWSITMYDGKTQLLIENPINRYLVNSPMLPGMKKNADGSLTLYIQKDSPGKDKESNWLPAPGAPIYLVMRLYWPKTEPPSILPPGEGTWSPPALTQVQ